MEAFRQQVRQWLQDNRPAEPAFQLPESFMEVGTEAQFTYLRDWQAKVYKAGYLGMTWPKEYGGGGQSQAHQDIVNAEMAAQKVPFVPNTIGLSWAGPLILAIGSEEQKRRYIPGILSGDDIWCQGFSEPDNGSDLAATATRAVRDGDHYILNGAKIWTSLGSYAKYMILLARTDPSSKRTSGLSYFLVPMQTPGIETQAIRKLTGEYGFTQTFFTDARVPASCLMGREGDGWKVAMMTLTFERDVAGGQAGGLKRIAVSVDDVIELARHCKRNGRPAIDDPVVREQLMRFVIEAQGDRLSTARGKIPALNRERPDAIGLSNKLRLTEHRRALFQFAIKLQGMDGGRSISQDVLGNWQRTYFNSFSSTIGGGTSQIQANIIGERVLGLPKDGA